jgi:hypothetical protein
MKKAAFVFAAVATVLLACTLEESVAPRAPDRLEPTSPAHVLKNVELAFNNRDIGLFKAMLSTDFIFYFDPREVGKLPPGGRGRYPIPESGSYSGIVRWVNDLFENAYFISLSIETGKLGRPDPEENTYRADNIKVTLIVKMDEVEGYIYNGYANVEFEKYAATGERYWRITNWWDRGGRGSGEYPASTPASLGTALAKVK